MSETESQLVGALQAAGHRITLPRRLICRVLADHPGDHLTAADIVALVDAPEGAVDLSTVYRSLEVFEELGLLHHVHLGHGPSIYHLSEQSDHHHLVCEVCGAVSDLPLDALEESFAGIISEHRFAPDGLHFAILGRHLDCSAVVPSGT